MTILVLSCNKRGQRSITAYFYFPPLKRKILILSCNKTAVKHYNILFFCVLKEENLRAGKHYSLLLLSVLKGESFNVSVVTKTIANTVLRLRTLLLFPHMQYDNFNYIL
jgi:hypothetical protein